MTSPSDLFAPCLDYLPTVPESTRDCADCARQYGERACSTFRERLMVAFGREMGLSERQVALLRELVRPGRLY